MTTAPKLMLVAVGGLMSLVVVMGIGRFVYTPILPVMVEALALTEGQAGFIASANYAGYLLGALLAATPAIHGSRRAWLLAALTLSAVSTAAMAINPTFGFFIAIRFVGGLASAFGLVFASTLVLERVVLAGRPQLSSIHFAGVGAGVAMSAILVSFMVALEFGWRSLWIASGCISLLFVVIIAKLVPDRADSSVQKPEVATRTGRALKVLIIAYGLVGFGYVITATFLVAIVRASNEIQSLEPVIWLIVGLAAVPSIGLWTIISDRIGIAYGFAIACLCQAAGVAASVLWLDHLGIFLAAILLGGTFVALTALGFTCARNLSTGDPRRTLALMTAAFGTGQIIGPAYAGIVHDITESFLMPSLTAVTALIVAAFMVYIVRRDLK